LTQSAVPNPRLPELIAALTGSMKIIFDIEKSHSEGGADTPRTFASLQRTIEKVAQTTRELYASKHCTEDLKTISWENPPSMVDMEKLARTFAKDRGLQLYGFRPSTSSARSRAASNLKVPKMPARRPSLRTRLREAVCHVMLCIPEVRDQHQKVPSWFAKLDRHTDGGDGNMVLAETLIYELDRSESTAQWKLLKEPQRFEQSLAALPAELHLFGLLKAQALMGERLSWAAAQQALDEAVKAKLIDQKAVQAVALDILQKCADVVKQSDIFHELQDTGRSLEDAAKEYLVKDVKLTPMDILVCLSSLEHMEVSDAVWAQLRSAET